MKVDKTFCEIIVNLHAFFNDCSKVSAWINTKNLNLGGYTPMTLIKDGRGKRVLQFIISALDENKPV